MSTQKKTYVPPAKRKEVPKAADLSMEELNDAKLFPTLKEGPTLQSKWNKQGPSFKQTIDNLIAAEKMSEQEKAAAEERRQANDGWIRFPAKPTHEMYKRYIRNMEKLKEMAANQEMMDYGYFRFGTYYIDGVPHYSAAYVPEEIEDDSDSYVSDNVSEANSEESI